ncbi:MAG: dethiobiotin synthase [Thermoleophilaceae bacterium]|nr:dethiobiotin synthase [Thermoleophilaceae bacterium]
MRGLFVTGTGTEVGKSVLTAAICAALVARGERVEAFKPVVTGLDEPAGEFGRDHDLLAAQTGQAPEEVAPYLFGPAVSPHLAAELAGVTIEPASLRPPAGTGGMVVCEGVGGLMVPLTPGYLVRDLAVDLALPVVVAARPGLGTINHTALTVEAARAAGLRVAGVVMTPWPQEPDAMQRSNCASVERITGVDVAPLAHTDVAGLAAAGGTLPLDEWLRA